MTGDRIKLEALLSKIVSLKSDSIHNYNSNGADWHTCRLCYAYSDEIRGVYQTIQHSDDCPGTFAEEILYEMTEGE